MPSEPVCHAELTQRSGIRRVAGGTSGLAPRAVLRGRVPVRYAARDAPPAPAHTCTVLGSSRRLLRAPRQLLPLSALKWSWVGEDGSPGVSWHVTAGGCVCSRRAAAVPFPKLAWETILGTALVCTSLHTHPGPERQVGPAGPPGTRGVQVLGHRD